MFKKTLFLPLILLCSLSLWAESRVMMNMELYNTLVRGEDQWYYFGSGKVGTQFKSTKNRNVQGELELKFFPYDGASQVSADESYTVPPPFVKKAYTKIRFPKVRFTLGKTRLSWGEGMVFNSGDVLFGSLTPFVNFSDEDIRSTTAWLTGVNVPLGNFSFVEGVIMPSSTGVLDKMTGGARFSTKMAGLVLEGGYVYKGEEKSNPSVGNPEVSATSNLGHRPYVSLQGNFGPDWYASSSVAIPSASMAGYKNPNEWKKSWNMSLGLYHLQEITRNNTLSMRLETLILPFQEWENQHVSDTIYALFLYPELIWSQGDSLSYSAQAVLSPLDGSGSITLGLAWNVFQGLYIMNYLTGAYGEGSSTFAWNRDDYNMLSDGANGMSFMSGVRYKY